jgi:hypothetical protein
VKTLEDFATCADWELAGGWTTEDGERVKDDGLLEPFDVSLEEAQNMVMTARVVLLGWVDHRRAGGQAAAEAEAAAPKPRPNRRGRGRGLRPLARAGHRDDAGRPDPRIGETAGAALHRQRRGAAQTGLIRFVVGPGRADRAGYAGQAARSRHLGQRRPRRAREGGEEEPLRPRRQAAGHVPEDLADRVEAGLPGGWST